ncbi:2-hydroxyacid dehydrogenase [Reyranella sp. MMS21-HV4-11]|uniref:2-hydroxyacid dehydrogenase n=1 Tax=Reyranella humidisoli TaxID=2849149 RepID=A0ABS6IHG2_9HYPH|nr:2-hydroxyacid dehydrogenase [Reyranella sp. MMS21-HV4-11]MBU8873771.1 2-hydroxyacid dehydrogenase [Reyranella sp. MMS21-HV4-11]
MRVAVFSTKPYDRHFLDAANTSDCHELAYLEPRLTRETAALADGATAVCAFVNDALPVDVLRALAGWGIRLVALRCTGFNNVDLVAARKLGITVARVPEYSPHAVAEHAVALVLALNRNIHRAYARVREGNFALEGFLGFDMTGRTVGVIGTGRIGATFARILAGFGCTILAVDPAPDPACIAAGVRYVELSDLLASADIVSLHCPLTPATRHLIDQAALARMRRGAMLINTSRGAVIDTPAVIAALKAGHLGHLGLDVYEEEADLFFEDLSDKVIQDDVFARLLSFPNVLVTGHQAFFTADALHGIAGTTIANITGFERDGRAVHEISVEKLA